MRYSAKQEIVRVVEELTQKLNFDKKHSVTVTMNISPFVLATWVVLLASSGVLVSVKNDDLEATVVALSCTLLRFCFFSSKKTSGVPKLIPAKATMKQQGRNKF